MISRYSVWLNDVSLAEISPNIYVDDIGYQAASIARNTSRLAAADGEYSGSSEYFAPNKINVAFIVREYSTQRRQEVIQNIIAWAAKGGWLKTSDRVGQKIYVKPTRLPTATSVMRWLDALTIEFTAFDYPFWQDENAPSITLSQGGNGELWVNGEHSACVEVTATAQANITTMTFTCNGKSIVLSGLSLVNGDKVKIRYTDEHHIQRIFKGDSFTVSNSLLDKRTPTSVDDLMANVGNNTLGFAADGNASCVFYVKGVHY